MPKYTRRQLVLFFREAAAIDKRRQADDLDNLSAVMVGKPWPGSDKLRDG